MYAHTSDLRALEQRVGHLERKVDQAMATEQELQNDLDAIKTAVTVIVQASAEQAGRIATLQAQVAAGEAVTPSQLDTLKSEADAILALLPGGAPGPAPAPPVTPGPAPASAIPAGSGEPPTA